MSCRLDYEHQEQESRNIRAIGKRRNVKSSLVDKSKKEMPERE